MENRSVQEVIDEMVRRIVDRFHPEKVVLFGSHARGTGGADSDADLLIVMRISGSKRKKAADIDLALAGVGLPKDVIVVTPEEVERYRNTIGTMHAFAVQVGLELIRAKGPVAGPLAARARPFVGESPRDICAPPG